MFFPIDRGRIKEEKIAEETGKCRLHRRLLLWSELSLISTRGGGGGLSNVLSPEAVVLVIA
jgi:hypothetical protein